MISKWSKILHIYDDVYPFQCNRFPPITKHDLHIMNYKISGSMVEDHMLNKHIKLHAYDFLQICVFLCVDWIVRNISSSQNTTLI
jgi:hypothetical protein